MSRIVKKVFVERTDKLLPQFLRYIWVGAATTLIDWGILNMLLAGFGVDKRIAAAAGYMTGVVANYFLCIAWIFRSDPRRRLFEFLGSMAIGAVGLAMNDLIIVWGSELLPRWSLLSSVLESLGVPRTELLYVNISKAVSVVTVLAWNFLARKYLIFRRNEKNPPSLDKAGTPR
ncbi:MAG: hypothetical protein DRP90_02370 [Planctomycetota bacterium]|nr:MAG: hypothetical protein DRP90_02370 [Planctomycetota bacterium]